MNLSLFVLTMPTDVCIFHLMLEECVGKGPHIIFKGDGAESFRIPYDAIDFVSDFVRACCCFV